MQTLDHCIVITEKPSQARDVKAVVGNQFGPILPAQGHLLSLKTPEEVNPDWKSWSFELLRPQSGRYPYKPSSGGGQRPKLNAIRDALKTARNVIIATDPDREGQLIGDEILQFYKYKGKAWRVRFQNADPKGIRDAFAKMEPNSNFHNLFQAGEARMQADQIFNLSMTRGVSCAYQGYGDPVLGVGRVRTPTLAIVCDRDREIANFKPLEFFILEADAAHGALEPFKMYFTPQNRILDSGIAGHLADHARGREGAVDVTVKQGSETPPKLFDLPLLQRATARKWGWSAKKTLEISQNLYEKHKLATYPRSEVKYLSEAEVNDVSIMLRGLLALPAFDGITVDHPVVRKGKSGHFCDACLAGESHTAIVPNVNAMDNGLAAKVASLPEDDRKLFQLIAKTYVAALMPDYLFIATVLLLRVLAHPEYPRIGDLIFKARGKVPKDLGWRALMQEDKLATDKADPETGADNQQLPDLVTGDLIRLRDVQPQSRKTKPPSHFNDGTLIEAMQDAWRFIDETNEEHAALREQLKESKGIGTPATRADIIDGLINQGFLLRYKKVIKTTNRGHALIDCLRNIAPEITNPLMTALWEMQLRDVEKGKRDPQSVIDSISEQAARHLAVIEKEKREGRARTLPGSGPS